MKKRKLLIIIVMVVFLLPFISGCAKNEEYNYSQKKVSTQKPEQKSSDGGLFYSGNLEGVKEAVLSAKSNGRVNEIKNSIGDTVKKNDLIVTLAGEENYSQRQTANSAYNNSIATLKNTESLMRQKISDAEVNLRIAEENLMAGLSADKNDSSVSGEKLKDAQLQLEMSEVNYNNLTNTFKQKKSDILDNISSAIIQSSILSNDAVSYIYSINNFSLPDDENDFVINSNFVVKTELKKGDAELAVIKAKESGKILSEFYSNNSGQLKNNSEVLFKGRDLAETSLNDAKKALNLINEIVLDSVTHTGMTQDNLNTFKAQIIQYRYGVENMLLSQDAGVAIGLNGAKQALENLEVEKENMLTQAIKQIELAKQKINLLEGSNNMSKDDMGARVKILEAQVDQARQSLETAKKYSDSQVQMSKTQSDLALGSLSLANVSVSNTLVRVPYDSVVVEKYLNEGEIVSAGTPIIKVADTSSLKLVIYVPEEQIKYFYKGLTATATAESFVGEEFEAVVERISPKTEESSKKVRVELQVQDPKYLKIGMMMGLELKVKEDDQSERDKMYIPYNAVISEENEKFVFIISDGKVKKKKVEIGTINDLNVEVYGGLTQEDDVVVKGLDGLKEGDLVEVIN